MAKKKAKRKRRTAKVTLSEIKQRQESSRKASGNLGKKKRAPKAKHPGRMSGLDAAAKILSRRKGSLSPNDLAEMALSSGLWTSAGKTPGATINAAIIREIQAKGKESRFKKTGPALFAFNR